VLAFLLGIVESKLFNPNRCVINVGGLGFTVYTSQASWNLLQVGNEAKLHTSLAISTDNVKIYGFLNPWEITLCEMLSNIKGISYRSALALMDGLSAGQIAEAVTEGDEDMLSKAPGIGKKTAERIIFELKTKLSELESLAQASLGENLQIGGSQDIGKIAETETVLRSLGYNPSEIEKAIRANAQNIAEESHEVLLRACLGWLSQN
jgi:holliday junction DNA helicase RuvA